MTFPGIEIIGFPFVLKIFASWGLLTALVSAAITVWQSVASHGRAWGDPWQEARRNRRAAIVWSYPGDDPDRTR